MAAASYTAKSPRPLPVVDALRALLIYDPQTGVLRWRPLLENSFRATGFNARFAYKAAGFVDRRGYVYLRIDRTIYAAHRIAWKMYYGEEAPTIIDHIDRNPSNNAISNLRSATFSENAVNRKVNSNSKSGHKFIHWSEKRRHYRLILRIDGRQQTVGSFKLLQDAIAERDRRLASVT